LILLSLEADERRFPTGRRIPTNGIHLAVREVGEGPAVFLLHGSPERAHSWRQQIRAIADAGCRHGRRLPLTTPIATSQ
jgi:pimeloyl-ACP methyl ester carboxylesterase